MARGAGVGGGWRVGKQPADSVYTVILFVGYTGDMGARVFPAAYPSWFKVRTEDSVSRLAELVTDSPVPTEAHYARAAAAEELREGSTTTGALEAYASLWRNRVVPSLTSRSRSREPLVWSWTGPWGHNYMPVRQSAIAFESAMLGVALGVRALRSGRAALVDGDERRAGAEFTRAVQEFMGVTETMCAWHDADAIALAPPVLRHGGPRAMEQHARAWLALAWANKCDRDGEHPEFSPRLYAGAHAAATRSHTMLRGVAAGEWRMLSEGFVDATFMLTVLSRAEGMKTREYGKAVAFVASALKTCKSPDNSVLKEARARVDKMRASNATVHFDTVPETLDIAVLMPAAHELDVPPPTRLEPRPFAMP